MLTEEALQEHIASWTKDFRSHYATALSDVARYTPIAWYQAVYAFIHDVKNSASISTNPGLQRLLPAVQKCNELLSVLAADQKDLAEAGRRELARFLSGPFTIPDLQKNAVHFLSGAQAHPAGPRAQKLLAQPLPWDSFSRARAQSAERYGFQFVSTEQTLPLSDLEAHDRSVESLLRGLGGLSVVRKLEPKTSSSAIKGKPDALVLDCYQIAALPADTPVPSPWKSLK